MPRLTSGKASVKAASRALLAGDDATAERELSGALDVVTELDRRGDAVAVLMATTLVKEVLEVIETDVPKTASGNELVARVLAGRRLWSIEHPLRDHLLAASRGVLDTFDEPFLRSVGLHVLREETRVTTAMERAIAIGHTEGCIRADEGRSLLTRRFARNPIPEICSRFVEVTKTARRLDRTRDAALRHAGTRTARR